MGVGWAESPNTLVHALLLLGTSLHSEARWELLVTSLLTSI